jgi:magnesium chelatase subunit D
MSLTRSFPFCAIAGQEQLKQALLLAAVDWRLSCLIRGEKGTGKSTAARALAEILPGTVPFVNVPIGVTEDRLLGGISLEAAFQGTASLKPGLVQAAHGGVLYIDEVNLLPGHLADTLLDVSATGRYVLERDGFSLTSQCQFVLLGSMNPEEGQLRPQLMDRFALAVDVCAPETAAERVAILKLRAEFDRDPAAFCSIWEKDQSVLRAQISAARERLPYVLVNDDLLHWISERVLEEGVRSLRADLAAARAAAALAALEGRQSVSREDVEAVLRPVLIHRKDIRNQRPPSSMPAEKQENSHRGSDTGSPTKEMRIFAPDIRPAPAVERIEMKPSGQRDRGRVNVYRSLQASARCTGSVSLRRELLICQDSPATGGTRFIFLVDASGSQAARQRMRLVKGAALSVLRASARTGDEVAVIVFRGAQAEILVEPTSDLSLAERKLELVPTGGRTPLAHALQLASGLINDNSCLILLTDGRANVAIGGGDPWQQALEAASAIRCPSLVVDTSHNNNARLHELARALRAELHRLDVLEGMGWIALLRR